MVGANDVGSVVGTTSWGLENNATAIPEIDIKVDSVSITANTKKLKAKWTPELQQDINAYHNLDAEVELTGILSEQIALEIDQEILEDLVKGARAGTYYWSRKPGKFVATNWCTGGRLRSIRLCSQILLELYLNGMRLFSKLLMMFLHRFIVRRFEVGLTSWLQAQKLQTFLSLRVVSVLIQLLMKIAAPLVLLRLGQISKKWDVYVDPYFPRNLILVGRKGNSFLESGYVYAPYVPLQVTPTIFGPEDFVPRKGVMTRYGKKMVRPDMYGLVVVEDLV